MIVANRFLVAAVFVMTMGACNAEAKQEFADGSWELVQFPLGGSAPLAVVYVDRDADENRRLTFVLGPSWQWPGDPNSTDCDRSYVKEVTLFVERGFPQNTRAVFLEYAVNGLYANQTVQIWQHTLELVANPGPFLQAWIDKGEGEGKGEGTGEEGRSQIGAGIFDVFNMYPPNEPPVQLVFVPGEQPCDSYTEYWALADKYETPGHLATLHYRLWPDATTRKDFATQAIELFSVSTSTAALWKHTVTKLPVPQNPQSPEQTTPQRGEQIGAGIFEIYILKENRDGDDNCASLDCPDTTPDAIAWRSNPGGLGEDCTEIWVLDLRADHYRRPSADDPVAIYMKQVTTPPEVVDEKSYLTWVANSNKLPGFIYTPPNPPTPGSFSPTADFDVEIHRVNPHP